MLVCLEHTGYYGLQLCDTLQELNIDYTAVPALEIKQSQGMTRGKSDPVDAKRIAIYAWRYADKIRLTNLPTKDLLLMKGMLSVRDQFVSISVQLQNSLKAHSIAFKVIGDNSIIKTISKQLESIKEEIKRLDDKILALVMNNDDIRKNFELLKSVKGIGSITAVNLILVTKNFTAIKDGRKFNAYAGIAPFKNESGNHIKGSRISHLANTKVKALLHNGACTAINYDAELRNYYLRKLEEGKAKLSVLNAVACKLVYRAFATVNRQTPYLNLYKNNFA